MGVAEECLKYEDEPWRVLEFFSGIGGMRYSLMESGVNAVVVEAFDINDKANDVYEHNFGHRPYQGNIQNLTAADLDNYWAHAWLLSPPCQPYTRQGLQKHSTDARAFSFLKILELIPHTKQPPHVLFVENVVGFETSDTRVKMAEIMLGSGFVMQEFILSPFQFSIPCSRPRYFCLAKRKPLSFWNREFNGRPMFSANQSYVSDGNTFLTPQEDQHELLQYCQPIENFLEPENSGSQVDAEINLVEVANVAGRDNRAIDQYTVPLKLIERWGSVMDIVDSNSKRCCCFTKSYYRYVKGTGSLLATTPAKKQRSFIEGPRA